MFQVERISNSRLITLLRRLKATSVKRTYNKCLNTRQQLKGIAKQLEIFSAFETNVKTVINTVAQSH